MKLRWYPLAIMITFLAAAGPPSQAAEVKSILRFEKEGTPVQRDERSGEREDATAEGGANGTAQGSAGSARQDALVEGSEEDIAAQTGEAEALALPGTPATLAPSGGEAGNMAHAPRMLERPAIVAPAIPGRTPAPRLGAAAPEREAGTEGISPGPDAPRPFVYERAPRAVGTATGYDAAVTPNPVLVDPTAPPIPPPGQPGAVQRPLPRLAPYGYALPPGQSTPPAAR
ncbi:MAG: hypothetical protein Q8R92_18475 [Deltaproteobacteria bacterium]|nr:hypothetical protein [Deltaproteobacteria bacterium]